MEAILDLDAKEPDGAPSDIYDGLIDAHDGMQEYWFEQDLENGVVITQPDEK